MSVPVVKMVSTTEHTASVNLEFKSTESKASAELGLAKILRRVASDIEKDVDRARSVMAP